MPNGVEWMCTFLFPHFAISANKARRQTAEHAFTDAPRDYLKRGWPHFGGDQARGGGGGAREEGKLLLWRRGDAEGREAEGEFEITPP